MDTLRASARIVAARASGSPIARSFASGTFASSAAVPLAKLRAIGLPEARAATILALARNVSIGHIDLSEGAAPLASIEALEALRGIGPWTSHYLAMRALRWPDAFVAGDLGVRKALGVTSTWRNLRTVRKMAAKWGTTT